MNQSAKLIKDWCLEQVGCPYIYGATKQPCTPDYREARIAQYPQYKDMIIRNCPRLKSAKITSCKGCRWAVDSAGRLAYDCAQLARFAMQEVGIALVSGANSQWQKTAFVKKGNIDEMPLHLLCLLYRQDSDGKMHHTGIYLGDGTIVHAKGHDYGVVHDNLSNPKFTHYGIPAGLYTIEELQDEGLTDLDLNLPTLRRGSSGTYVVWIQEYLNKTIAADLIVDGIFGAGTQDAVSIFQKKLDLTADGIVGPKTWAKLPIQEEIPKPEPAPEPIQDLVSIPRTLIEEVVYNLQKYL